MKIALVLALCAVSAYGYVFNCLEGCECDTADEVIHCHNGDRTEVPLPKGQRLRGFPILGLTYNKIVRLPDEEVLLSKFPDLKIVDVERNDGFDCSTLENYSQLKIVSDCSKNISEIARVPKIFRPTATCDLACQLRIHYDKLHEYVLNLWEVIKEKYRNWDVDSTLRTLQSFFNDVVNRVNRLGKDIHEEVMKKSDSTNPKFIRPDEQPEELMPTLLP